MPYERSTGIRRSCANGPVVARTRPLIADPPPSPEPEVYRTRGPPLTRRTTRSSIVRPSTFTASVRSFVVGWSDPRSSRLTADAPASSRRAATTQPATPAPTTTHDLCTAPSCHHHTELRSAAQSLTLPKCCGVATTIADRIHSDRNGRLGTRSRTAHRTVSRTLGRALLSRWTPNGTRGAGG